MGKPITFEYEGVKYSLEYTKGSIKAMEQDGFAISELKAMPQTMIDKLWDGAFIAHHKYTKKEVKDAIYKRMENKEKLLTRLSELYIEPINALMEEPQEGEKIGWE